MKITRFERLLPASVPSRIVAILLSLPYFYIGIKEVISPAGLDSSFGIPLVHAEGLHYLSVVGARNMVLSLMGIFFSVIGMRVPMVVLFIALACMAAMDCFLVSSANGISGEAIKHALFVLFMAGMALWIAYSKMT